MSRTSAIVKAASHMLMPVVLCTTMCLALWPFGVARQAQGVASGVFLAGISLLACTEASRFGLAVALKRITGLLAVGTLLALLCFGLTWSYVSGSWPRAAGVVAGVSLLGWAMHRVWGRHLDWSGDEETIAPSNTSPERARQSNQRSRRSAQPMSRFDMVVKPTRIGFDNVSERALFLLTADNSADIAAQIELGSQHFVALLAWDAEAVDPHEIGRVARILLDSGCVYFCCWGPGCERVHDIIDEEQVGDGTSINDDDLAIMTTWHNNVSLEEATWFALYVAFPDDRFFDSSRALVAICIDNATWSEQLKVALADPGSLSERVVGQDDMRPNKAPGRTREE